MSELRQLQEEQLRRLLEWKYKVDPLCWLEEKLGENPNSFKWSNFAEYENHEWDGDRDPLYQAWQTVADVYRAFEKGETPKYRKVGIESATGTGKTHFLARLCTWFLDVFENSLVVTTAPKKAQLEIGLWREIANMFHKVKKIRPEAQLYNLRLMVDDRGVKALESEDEEALKDAWQAVGFVAGVGSAEESANRARGIHAAYMLIILEECPGIRQPVITAFQNTSTGTMNIIVAVGNPDNQHDPLHRFCNQSGTKAFRISAFDHPNLVLNKEIFAGAASRVSIANQADVFGEGSPMYNAMARGICPSQSQDSLIKLDWIEQCINLELPENMQTYNAVGVDVANSQAGDKAALCWGQGSTCVLIQEFQCPNATHLGYNLFMDSTQLALNNYIDFNTPTISEYNINSDCVGIDAVGVGVATVNALLDEGMNPQALQGGQWQEVIPQKKKMDWSTNTEIEQYMYRFNSLRSQMYWEAREDLRQAKISIKLSDLTMLSNLKKELTIPKFDPKGGSIQVESKESIKKRLGKSPNVADAFVYWNWARKGYRLNRFFHAAISGGL